MLNSFLKSRIKDGKRLVKELSNSYDYVSILGNYIKTKRIMVSTSTSSIDDLDNECGFVIKVYKDGHYSEYSCDDIKGLKADTVINSIELKSPYFAHIKMLSEEKHEESYLREDEKPLSDKEIFDRLTKLKKNTHDTDSRIINVTTAFVKRETSKIFISNNKCLDQKYDWCNAMLSVVTRVENNIQENYTCGTNTNSADALDELMELSGECTDIALRLLSAKTIVPGKYEIITDPYISGLIAHEAFGHGVEMDMFVKNRAKAKDFVNKQVASELVNMHDGASATLSSASYFFDDDGILANDTQIIKDGILVDGLSDVLTALELNKKPSGNSRRESTRRKAYTRMTNTFFGAGKDNVDDMIKSIKHGYYLCDTNNGMEDPKNWQIQCTAQYALEIEDGKFNGNIYSPVVISGYVPDLLKSISMVSDEVIITGSGMCGKGHKEWVYVADGGPYLKARVKLG